MDEPPQSIRPRMRNSAYSKFLCVGGCVHVSGRMCILRQGVICSFCWFVSSKDAIKHGLAEAKLMVEPHQVKL